MTIEPIIEVFGYYYGKAISRMRDIIFEEFAESENYGLIFTYMWILTRNLIGKYNENVTNIFRKNGADKI